MTTRLRGMLARTQLGSRIAVACAGVAVAAVATMAWAGYSSTAGALRDSALEEIQVEGTRRVLRFEQALAAVRADARYLSDTASLRHYLRGLGDEGLGPDSGSPLDVVGATIVRDFGLLLHAKGYDQVRFLSADGQELVKVAQDDSTPAGYRSASGTELQNKLDRDYVLTGLGLRPGQLHTSAIELSGGHGEPGSSLETTIRVVAPVYMAGLALGESSPDLTQGTEAKARAEVAEEIQRYDELLSSAVLSAAVQGDLGAADTYQENAEYLERALWRAIQIGGPLGSEAARWISRSNDRLLELEERALDLVLDGRSAEALTLVQGAEYAEHKQHFAAGLERLRESLTAELAGLVVVNIDADRLLNDFHSGGFEEQSLLVDAAGFYLHHHEAEREWGLARGRPEHNLALDAPGLWAQIQGLTFGQRVVLEEDGQQLVAYSLGASAERPNAMTAVLRADDSGLLAVTADLRLRTFLVALAACLSMVLVGARLGRHLSAPIADLTGRVTRLMKGDFDVSFEVQHPDREVGRLALAFDGLYGNLQRSMGEARQAAEEAGRSAAAVREANRNLERKVASRTQELEVALNAAEDSSRAKSDFLATMSHEIRTPMNGIIGMTELLIGCGLEGDQREYAQTVRSSGEALLSIINDILDFSKIEAGMLEFEQLEFDPVALLEESLEVVAHRAHGRGLELVGRVEGTPPLKLVGDPMRLRQVLANLMGNACKFTAEGEVTVTLEVTGADLAIAVRDTGIGVAEDVIARLFDKFTQADESTTRKFGGTGLGLAICKQLIELMGGEISCESEVGVGSCFRFHVPLTEVAGAARPEPRRFPLHRALVVEPSAAASSELVAQLEARGLEAVVFPGPSAALAAPSSRWDLLVVASTIEGEASEWVERLREHFDQAVPTLVLDRMGTKSQLGEEPVKRLMKPLRRARLDSALVELLVDGPASPLPKLEPEPEQAQSYPDLRVLLVEDNAVNQVVARRMLNKFGVDPVVAKDGSKAVAAVHAAHFDLILMDCRMPVMDGFEATRRIREDAPGGAKLLIFAMTANALAGDREACLEAGMDDYLTKPARMTDLARALEQAERLRVA